MSGKTSRRDFVKTAAAGIVGFGVGAGVGYGASQMMAPPTGVAPTVTKTVELGKTPRGVPKEPIKIGIVSWFTGPSTMVGEACYGGARFAADEINKAGGILGRKIEVLKRDCGTPEVTVDAVRRFVLEDKVDLMGGDVGGSNCNAIVPHIEQLKVPFFFQCSTTVKEVEELDPNPLYVFRTGEQNLAEPNVAAQLIVREFPNAKRIAGINPDYVYGREAMMYTMKALNKLAPHMESVLETWPPLGATDFSSHITAVLDAKPDVVITACWGGDFVTFAKQATAYGLFQKTNVVSILGSMALNSLTKDIVPPGVWMLQRDYYFEAPPHNLYPLNKWFVETYRKRENKFPEFDVMQIFSGIFAYKQAVERVYAATGSYPENEEICRAIQNSQVVSPAGHRVITSDGQFINPLPYGKTWHDPKYPIATIDPKTLGFIMPEYVYNPKSLPPVLQYPLGTGMKYSDWIASW
ncbi:ABC transporter substrate-binding protein [Candidatus Bathyarchaeota archaeon]|nr:ABC transporter substrate-binding protein [Candidatus Bathyarchaeota archaeon]MBS7628627.1 ABC transporter substrate-binding protein [Candidatus Bathyarchaeota archaeon]